MTEPVLVRVAPEILEQLATEGSEPVVVLGITRQDDGTHDMVLRSVDRNAEIKRLREAGDRLAAEVEARWSEPGTCDCAVCSAARRWRTAARGRSVDVPAGGGS